MMLQLLFHAAQLFAKCKSMPTILEKSLKKTHRQPLGQCDGIVMPGNSCVVQLAPAAIQLFLNVCHVSKGTMQYTLLYIGYLLTTQTVLLQIILKKKYTNKQIYFSNLRNTYTTVTL